MGRLGSQVARLARWYEAPTWALIVAIYGGWLALTWWWNSLPFWVLFPAGAWLCAWHMSLQHELIHGHPTRNSGINAALGTPPLNLWLPYSLYRESHIRHHRDAYLTDPIEDPESTYMAPETWRRAGTLQRVLHRACNTLCGRMLAGPAQTMISFWMQQRRRTDNSDARRCAWAGHAAAASLLLVWVCIVCRIDLLAYLACFVYPGTSLTMIRSLAEHRAAARPQDRTAVVENAGLLGLLFLNNNLHVLHHEHPSIPWYMLPAQWRLARTEMLGTRCGPVYRGYGDVAARYGFRPQHPGTYPAPVESPVVL